MKRASNSYRLQLIKEVATRQERLHCEDPMVNYIQQLLDDSKSDPFQQYKNSARFSGSHFDDNTGGWISDKWDVK
ncbi:hypothetical protein [Vibrio ostreicida]|uniref:hypothetical protein n=1 Tax=Vibrio ostreicida TaxID=526588 RepID=UPI000970573C|nr:hypothetical protein [Vibrio ostreicida]